VNPVTGTRRASVDIGGDANLELVDKFCYLDDMLSVDGDADAAVEIRIRIGWNKFRQLVPLRTNKDISLSVRGRLYTSCVQSSMLHGSETWPVRKENEVALQKLQDTDHIKELRERLGLDDIQIQIQIFYLHTCNHTVE